MQVCPVRTVHTCKIGAVVVAALWCGRLTG
jgi:hypothetical protein